MKDFKTNFSPQKQEVIDYRGRSLNMCLPRFMAHNIKTPSVILEIHMV